MLAEQCDYSGLFMSNATASCLNYYNDFYSYIEKINIYDLYGICYGEDPYPQKVTPNTPRKAGHYSAADYTPWL